MLNLLVSCHKDYVTLTYNFQIYLFTRKKLYNEEREIIKNYQKKGEQRWRRRRRRRMNT